MVTAWLFDNTPTGLWTQNIFASVDREYGNRFSPLANGRVTAMRWRRPATVAVQKPTILRLWDVATATVLATAPSIPDNGAVGWQQVALTTPVNVTAAQVLCASFAWQTNRQYTSGGLGIVPAASYPAGFQLPAGWATATSTIGHPNNAITAEVFGVDALVQTQAPPASWTSVATTSYSDSLKWAQPANRYRINITTPVQWQTAKIVEGVDVRRVVGFWQPFLDGYLLERKPIDALQIDLMLPDRSLMDGLLLDTFPGSEGTAEAFTLDS